MKNTVSQFHFFALVLLFTPLSKGYTAVDGKGKATIPAGISKAINPAEEMGATPVEGKGKAKVEDVISSPASESETAPECSPKPAPKLVVLDYKDPIHFMSDFLDVNKKPEKTLRYWTAQLLMLLKGNARLTNFCVEIKDIALSKDMTHERRTKDIYRAFFQAYSDQLFTKDLSAYIFSVGLGKAKDAIKMRAAKP